MSSDRPGPPGEALNFGRTTEPRAAGTVILLRGGADALQVLLVRRNPSARFMGGAWVFPGGAVDRHEGEGDRAVRTAAIRELEEEAAIAIDDPDQLVPFSRWITPAEVKIRFDTWFYLAPEPPGAEARPDGSEVVDARWYEPAAALEARQRGELFLVFPDHQAPRAAVRVRLRRRASRARARARDPSRAASGVPPGRDGPDRPPRRARLR